MNSDRTQEILIGMEARLSFLESQDAIRSALVSSWCLNLHHTACRGYAQPRVLRYQRIRCPCPCHEASLRTVTMEDASDGP